VAGSVESVLVQPAQSLTDLLLGVVVVLLALRLRRSPSAHGYWRAAFWWAGVGALAGAVHHGVIMRWPHWGDLSWAIISVIVVVAVSYLLASTVAEVLGPGRVRVFWLLRSVGIVAYVLMAATGHAGIAAILSCESLTMLSVLILWGWAAIRGHPLARPVLIAIAASGAAGAAQALSPDVTDRVGLDPTSVYHLAQIVGMVLLYLAIGGSRWVGDTVAPVAPVERAAEPEGQE
jgi:asparagine N-glycosylation enzyme membrane subunit Stt3